MSFLLLENRLSIDTLVVPGYFIDRFLPAASGTDVKVYLYLLRAVSTSATGLSSASISDRLDISEREVLRSLSYWESVGLMRLSFTSGHELSGVVFTDPSIQAERCFCTDCTYTDSCTCSKRTICNSYAHSCFSFSCKYNHCKCFWLNGFHTNYYTFCCKCDPFYTVTSSFPRGADSS